MAKTKKKKQQQEEEEENNQGGGGNQKKKSETSTNGYGRHSELLESRKTATGEIEGLVQWTDANGNALEEPKWVVSAFIAGLSWRWGKVRFLLCSNQY